MDSTNVMSSQQRKRNVFKRCLKTVRDEAGVVSIGKLFQIFCASNRKGPLSTTYSIVFSGQTLRRNSEDHPWRYTTSIIFRRIVSHASICGLLKYG